MFSLNWSSSKKSVEIVESAIEIQLAIHEWQNDMDEKSNTKKTPFLSLSSTLFLYIISHWCSFPKLRTRMDFGTMYWMMFECTLLSIDDILSFLCSFILFDDIFGPIKEMYKVRKNGFIKEGKQTKRAEAVKSFIQFWSWFQMIWGMETTSWMNEGAKKNGFRDWTLI